MILNFFSQLLNLLDGVQTWTLKLDKLADTLAIHTNQTKERVSYQ